MTGTIAEHTMVAEDKEQNPEMLLPYESPVLIELFMMNDVVRGNSGKDDQDTGEEEYEE